MSSRILIFFCLILIATISGRRRERIVGGGVAGTNEFPYQALIKRISSDVILCGGAIISTKFIISVATCVDDRHNSHANMRVQVGNPHAFGNTGNSYLPNRIFIHPEYTGEILDYSSIRNDIAIIRLQARLDYNIFQQAILLPSRDVQYNQFAVLSGWGSVTYPMLTFPNILHKFWLRIITHQHCKQTYPLMPEDQFCGFQRAGVGICIGDGGSPLVSDNRLVGLASCSFQCAAGLPDVYTNIYYHLDFIFFVMSQVVDNMDQPF